LVEEESDKRTGEERLRQLAKAQNKEGRAEKADRANGVEKVSRVKGS
jgi:hypothetical protein